MNTQNARTIIILGCTVTLRFAETPNDDVANSVRRILKESYLRRCSAKEAVE